MVFKYQIKLLIIKKLSPKVKICESAIWSSMAYHIVKIFHRFQTKSMKLSRSAKNSVLKKVRFAQGWIIRKFKALAMTCECLKNSQCELRRRILIGHITILPVFLNTFFHWIQLATHSNEIFSDFTRQKKCFFSEIDSSTLKLHASKQYGFSWND